MIIIYRALINGQTYWAKHPKDVRSTVDLAVLLARRYIRNCIFRSGITERIFRNYRQLNSQQYNIATLSKIRAACNKRILIAAPLMYQEDPNHLNDFAMKTHAQEYDLVFLDMNEGKNINFGIPAIPHLINICK
ncbi:unnamed protein product (macronuclear) [Paramecium tetraurelia]|uniref:Uncharacterized protein n=1 Tax=Paramecium tetraurelia TaxID=5888 RepID=A0E1Q3_PARTE|nr:uncharacterized protein GSPATT00022391001 [Paramecium tetraurelia]CAK89220.1 unnamed protein product [Paramecium tetraurelia]|eukprot:XP_001456617.1 hypothetical protein (macronuclear) [Paramecium tetraurelia strain d4-2]